MNTTRNALKIEIQALSMIKKFQIIDVSSDKGLGFSTPVLLVFGKRLPLCMSYGLET